MRGVFLPGEMMAKLLVLICDQWQNQDTLS